MPGRGRAVMAVALMVGVLLGGCATFKNTQAQDLARDRLARCNRFPSVSVRDLAPDGSMTVVSYGAGAVGEYAAWRACMEDAFAEQKKQGKIAADAEQNIVQLRAR
jgi:hypothetical protein